VPALSKVEDACVASPFAAAAKMHTRHTQIPSRLSMTSKVGDQVSKLRVHDLTNV
jgi:hypothetical protein